MSSFPHYRKEIQRDSQAVFNGSNSASIEELSTLAGNGKGTAGKIVEYRKDHKFKKTSDLMDVKGIGQKKFDKIQAKLSI